MSDAIESNSVIPEAACDATSPMDKPVDAEAAWLHQARMVRDEALRLLRVEGYEGIRSPEAYLFTIAINFVEGCNNFWYC